MKKSTGEFYTQEEIHKLEQSLLEKEKLVSEIESLKPLKEETKQLKLKIEKMVKKVF